MNINKLLEDRKDSEYIIKNYKEIIENINDAIIVIDITGKIAFISDNAKRVFGISNRIKKNVKNILDLIPGFKIIGILHKEDTNARELYSYKKKILLVKKSYIKNDKEIIGISCIFEDIEEFEKLREELKSEKDEVDLLKTVLEIAYDGIIVIDTEGYIKVMSIAYKKFLGIKNNDNVIGKHVADVIENTRLHLVAKTGVSEVGDLQEINGNYIIVSRIPVFKDGKISSVVGKIIFRNINDLEDLHTKINKMELKLENYKDEFSNINKAKYNFESIKGDSTRINNTKKMAIKAAHTDSNILIIGESGTGKELFAHSIHTKSQRRSRPFIKVNCAAIPNELLESELFGYEEGAFTGAKKTGKMGKFEVADGGTIFLDEIGDMPLHMQAKLLRVLQEKEIEKLGSNKTKEVDIRIIAATNKNLEEMVKNKQFRMDLYYRLNVVTVIIPPLRERKGDIKILIESFIEKYRLKYLKRINGISKEATQKLLNYEWPGNIRELENIIERAINLLDTEEEIKLKHLPSKITKKINIEETKCLKELMDEAEKKVLYEYLEATGNNKSKTAKLLGISRTALYEKMSKYKM